jgi:hypothetical protein
MLNLLIFLSALVSSHSAFLGDGEICPNGDYFSANNLICNYQSNLNDGDCSKGFVYDQLSFWKTTDGSNMNSPYWALTRKTYPKEIGWGSKVIDTFATKCLSGKAKFLLQWNKVSILSAKVYKNGVSSSISLSNGVFTGYVNIGDAGTKLEVQIRPNWWSDGWTRVHMVCLMDSQSKSC